MLVYGEDDMDCEL